MISDYSLSNVADKIAVDASGDRLAISGMSSGLYLCEAKTGRCIRTISNQCTPSKAPVFSRDGKWLMAANGIQISLYHVDTGKIVWRTGIPSSDPFFSIAFSPDGEWIAASGVRSGILIFHRIDGKLHRQLPSVSSLHRIAFSSANDTLYSGSTDGSIHFWSLSAGRQMQILKLLEEG